MNLLLVNLKQNQLMDKYHARSNTNSSETSSDIENQFIKQTQNPYLMHDDYEIWKEAEPDLEIEETPNFMSIETGPR